MCVPPQWLFQNLTKNYALLDKGKISKSLMGIPSLKLKSMSVHLLKNIHWAETEILSKLLATFNIILWSPI